MADSENRGIDFAGESFLSGIGDTLKPGDFSLDLRLPFNNIGTKPKPAPDKPTDTYDYAQYYDGPPDTMIGNVDLIRTRNPGWIERQVRRFGPMVGRKLCTFGKIPGLMYYKNF